MTAGLGMEERACPLLSQIRLCAAMGDPASLRFLEWIARAEAQAERPLARFEETLDRAIGGDLEALGRLAECAAMYLEESLKAWCGSSPGESGDPA